MIAVPLLVGISGTTPVGWHVALAIAAVTGYLTAATAQAWLRARRRTALAPSLAAYGAIFTATSLALVLAYPGLLLAAVVIAPAGALLVIGARPGTPRDLVSSLAQAAIALTLVPAAALVAGSLELDAAVRATLVAGGYLVGTVLVVRSVIRERGRRRFAGLSIGFHAGVTVLVAATLAWPYAIYFVALTLRAMALPLFERRRAGTARPLRPIQVGVVEIVASAALVLLAFAVPR